MGEQKQSGALCLQAPNATSYSIELGFGRVVWAAYEMPSSIGLRWVQTWDKNIGRGANVVAHIYNPSTRRLRQEDLQLKGTLGYIAQGLPVLSVFLQGYHQN